MIKKLIVITVLVLIVPFLCAGSVTRSLSPIIDVPPTEPDIPVVAEPLPDGYIPMSEIKSMHGSLSSEMPTSIDLILDWEYRCERGDDPYLHITLSLQYDTLFISQREGSLSVGDKVYTFATEAINDRSAGVHKKELISVDYPLTRGLDEYHVPFSAKWRYHGTYNNIRIENIVLCGYIDVGEQIINLDSKASIPVQNVMQIPELPNGCEITSLTIVLNYKGFDVSKLTMSDKYLPKGALGKVAPISANIGDPRNQYGSYGCYAPVIVKAAENFFEDQGVDMKATDLTGSSPKALYAQIANGNPVIAWATIDLKTPYLLNSWNIGGEIYFWKHPLHCMVLCGYDLLERTVTIADPLVGIRTFDMDDFELRYKQLWSQAVVIE